jgi:hypothetical protein
MTWYYAIGNERQGPVDDAELDRLIASRTVTPDTLVWRAGMADWQPLAQARPPAARPAPPPPAPLPAPTPTPVTPQVTHPVPVASSTPASTPTPVNDPATQPKFGGGTFGTPGFGAAPGASAGSGGAGAGGYGGSTMGAAPTEDPAAILDRVSRSGRRIAIGECISRGWELVSANFGLAIGTTAVVMIAIAIGRAIPCLGFFIGLVIRPVLTAGLFLFFLKLLRNQNAEFGDAFSGFSIAFLPLFLQGLVVTLLTLVVMAPGGVLLWVGALMSDGYSSSREAMGFALMALGGLLMLPAVIYVSVIWVFSLPLIIDKRMDFWPAMELSRKVAQQQFFSVFGLLFLCGLIVFAGLIALCLGIFVAAPVAVAAVTVAYEDLFGQ